MFDRVAIVAVSSLVLLAGCDSHAYYEEAMAYVSEAEKILVETRWCQKPVPCSAKDMVKFEASGWQLGPLNYGGVYINVYEVDDLSVADKVIARLREKQKSMPTVPVHVRIHASKHSEPKKITAEAKIG